MRTQRDQGPSSQCAVIVGALDLHALVRRGERPLPTAQAEKQSTGDVAAPRTALLSLLSCTELPPFLCHFRFIGCKAGRDL